VHWLTLYDLSCFFFFQAEDGIRDATVTGVQTCALPISSSPTSRTSPLLTGDVLTGGLVRDVGEDVGTYAIRQGTLTASSNYALKIGRASCRERVRTSVVADSPERSR